MWHWTKSWLLNWFWFPLCILDLTVEAILKRPPFSLWFLRPTVGFWRQVQLQWNLFCETTCLQDHILLAESFTSQCNWTGHQRPPVLRDHIFMANMAVFQDRLTVYSTEKKKIFVPENYGRFRQLDFSWQWSHKTGCVTVTDISLPCLVQWNQSWDHAMRDHLSWASTNF